MPRRQAHTVRGFAGGVAVVKIIHRDDDGWESPAWYAVRRVGEPEERRYGLTRLGSKRVYYVELGDRLETSTCECLGSGGDGRSVCRHTGALFALAAAGWL